MCVGPIWARSRPVTADPTPVLRVVKWITRAMTPSTPGAGSSIFTAPSSASTTRGNRPSVRCSDAAGAGAVAAVAGPVAPVASTRASAVAVINPRIIVKAPLDTPWTEAAGAVRCQRQRGRPKSIPTVTLCPSSGRPSSVGG